MRQNDHKFFNILIYFCTALVISGCFPKVSPPSLVDFPEKKTHPHFAEQQKRAAEVDAEIRHINQQKEDLLNENDSH